MLDYELAKQILVYLILTVPPLLVYIRFWRERDRGKVLIIAISIIYIAAAVYTENLMPFILVLFNLAYMKGKDEYREYGFSLRGFSILEGIGCAVFSYLITIMVALGAMYVMNYFGIRQEEQEVVKWLTDLPLKWFWIAVPVIVLFAPVVEEFIFRWFFYERLLKKKIGVIPGALLSSMIFALVHFNAAAFAMILWIGIYNCYLIDRKGYWYAVFNHMFFNSITVAVLLMSKMQV
jgi:membrane protease YdiL (CAAX protease family)